MITLFAEPPRSSNNSFTFIASIVLHASLFGLLTYKVMNSHRVIERFPLDRYSLRVLDLHSKEPQTRQSAEGGIVYRGPKTDPKPGPEGGLQSSLYAAPKPAPTVEKEELASTPSTAGSPPAMRRTPRLLPAPQTLVQPDVPKNIVMPDKTPVPLVVLWAPDKVVKPRIVPPMPEKAVIAVVQPSLDTPIPEEKLADLKLSSSSFLTVAPVPPPSTTSPVVVHGPEEAKKVPETTSKQPEKSTPARILSLSDIRVPEGKIAVPAANQTASKVPPGSVVPGVLLSPSPSGNGESASKASQSAPGKGAADQTAQKGDGSANSAGTAAHSTSGSPTAKSGNPGAGQSASAQPAAGQAASGSDSSKQGSSNHLPSVQSATASGDKPAVAGRPGAQTGSQISPADGAASGSDIGHHLPGGVHISLPRDGQFGAVVIGSSIEDKYPETAELWSGRLASTVYLHVGLAKSWILQYALPRLADAASVAGGRVEAPWPFEIVRPNLQMDNLDSAALILHGFVNKDGRFEKLEVVYPPEFPQSRMVVGVIGEWQFRPARQNGQYIPVEILLIIPDQTE
jgi:hypothetical protein